MPNNGRLIEWKSLRLRCVSSMGFTGSGAGSPVYAHQNNVTTAYVPNVVVVSTGIALHAESSFDGTVGAWMVSYNGPGAPFGGYIVSGASFLSTVSIYAIPRNVKIYGKLTGSLIRLVWGQVDIYVNGAFNITLPFSAVDLVSAGCGPNYVPLIGEPVFMSGGGSGGRTSGPGYTYDPCDPGAGLPITQEADATGSASGGWDFEELDGTWIALPCSIYEHDPSSSGGCPFGLSVEGILSADDTASGAIGWESYAYNNFEYIGRENGLVDAYYQCVAVDDPPPPLIHFYTGAAQCTDRCTGAIGPLYRDVFKTTIRRRSHGGSVQLVPNLERVIQKLGDSYRAVWFRGDFPECKAGLSRSCSIDGVTVSISENPIVYPAESVFLGCVGSAPHVIEDPLAFEIFCPSSASASEHEDITFSYEGTGPCVCGPYGGFDPTGLCPSGIGYFCHFYFTQVHNDSHKSESVACNFPTSVSNAGGYQWHLDPVSRYLGTWPNPHWQYLFWNDLWDLDGSPTDWATYWGPIEEQWLYNAALPAIEQRRTRNSIILSPVQDDQGNTPFLDFAAGGLRWIGVSRFKVEAESLLSSITLNQTRHGEWNARDTGSGPEISSITFLAGGVHLSGLASTHVAVDLEFGSWTADPFMLLYRAKAATLGWSATNVVSITMSLVGYDGTLTPLGTAAGTYPIGTGLQTKYAGSWGLDNGAGVVSDEGTDSLANGISTTIMSDPEAVLAFQLGTGRAFKSIRFEIVATSSASPVDLNWPSFDLVDDHPRLCWENSKACSMLWPDQMGLRWGNWEFYDPFLGFQDPPLISGLGIPSTIIDWKAFRHRFLRGDGGASLSSTITSELSVDYDFYEGQSIAVVDKFSRGVILPKSPDDQIVRGAMINSFSEFPPFACFPYRKRANDWLATGDHAQVVYDMCEEKRPLISPSSSGATLSKPDDTLVGGFVSAPSGWKIWEYAPVLDNSETDWKIKVAGSEIALLRPWSGYFCLPQKGRAAKGIAIMQTSEPRYVKASQNDDSNIVVQCAGFSIPPYIIETVATSTGDCSDPCLAPDPLQSEAIILAYARSNGNTYQKRSYNYAQDWDTEVMAFSGAEQPKVRSGNQYEISAAFRYVSGSSGPGRITCARKGDGAAAYGSEAYWLDDVGAAIQVEATGYDFCHAQDEQDRWLASFTVYGESTSSDWYSTDDALSWTRI